MKSIGRYLVFIYLQLFSSIIIISFILISWITYYQIKEMENNYVDKIVKVLEQHKYTLLNETALQDKNSIEEHLKQITLQLNLDGILYSSNFFRIFQNKKGFVKTNPFIFNISDDFNNYPVSLKIYYKESLHKNYFIPLFKIIVFIYTIFFLAICTIFYVLYIKIKSKLIIPLISLTKNLDQPTISKDLDWNSTLYEINQLYNKIISTKEIEEIKKDLALKEIQVITRETISKQVAHDIRSPLAVLNMMIRKSLDNINEEERIIIRNQFDRISDIANSLIVENKQLINNEDKNNDIEETAQLLSSAIEEIVTEKRIYFRSKLGITIDANVYEHESYGLFSKINTREFKNILSNLINNSVEALIKDTGVVSVILQKYNTEINQIIIKDNGKGIPNDIISSIGQLGFTYGKENTKGAGTGFGIFHAKNTLKKWGGNLNIESSNGTEVTINLPKALAPDWFIHQITIFHDQTIVIIDDDKGIHLTWKNRFDEIMKNNNIKIYIHHISNPIDLETWIRNSHINNRNSLFLSDYELIGYSETGLDLLEKFNIKNSILVTSYYEDENIRERCRNLGIKIIPKMLAGFVPIQLNKDFRYDIVFIDDDKHLRRSWEISSKKIGKSILTIDKTSDFNQYKSKISQDHTMIYIDSNLGPNEIRGEQFAKQLYEKGFKNIYLATGYDPKIFADWPWFKVVGKEFPLF